MDDRLVDEFVMELIYVYALKMIYGNGYF